MGPGVEKQPPNQIPVNDEPVESVTPLPKSTASYADYMPPKRSRPKWMRWLIWLVVLLVIMGALVGAYKVLKKNPAAGSTSDKSQSSTSQSQTTTKTITAATKNYSSQNFTLSFDYPNDWTLTDSGGGVMTVKSPAVTLTDAAGQKINGQIVLTFRSKGQKLNEFSAGSAMAASDSTKIAYTKPTQSQRGDTYLSFLRYASYASSAGLDGVYITGNAGYKANQTVPATDISGVDPVINFSFAKCTDSTCSSSTATAIAVSSWSDQNLSTPLLNILKSLVIT